MKHLPLLTVKAFNLEAQKILPQWGLALISLLIGMLLPGLPRWVISFGVICIARKCLTQKGCFPFGNKTVQSEKYSPVYLHLSLSLLISSACGIISPHGQILLS